MKTLKIVRVEIENFRFIESARVDIDRGLALFGMNGQGKSSVLDAVRMALFGACGHTGADGRGAAELIRHGAREANVTVQTSAGSVILNITAKKKDWTWFDAAGQVSEDITCPADLWKSLGINPDHARICAMSEQFIENQDLGNLIAAMFTDVLTEAAVLSNAGEHLEWLTKYAADRKRPVSDVKFLGDAAYAARTDLNRELKIAKAELEGMGMRPTPPKSKDGKTLTLAYVSKVAGAVAKLQGQRDALQRELGAADKALSPEAREAQMVEWRQVITDGEAYMAEQDGLIRDARTQKQEYLNEVCGPEAALQAEKSKGSGKCPLGYAPCVALGTGAANPELIKDLEAIVTRLRGYIDRCDETSRTADAEYKKAEKAVNAARANLAALERQIATRPAAEIHADLEATDAEIERVMGIKGDLVKVSRWDDLTASMKLWEAEIEHLSWACTQFRDGAMLKALSASRFDEFTARVNESMAEHGYTFGLQVDGKTVTPTLTEAARGTTPISKCSGGEKAMAAAAIAQAFAACGAPVLIDEMNTMDVGHRKIVLNRAKRSTNTVILAAAWQQKEHDMAALAKAMAPLGVAWVEEGKLT